MAFDGFGTFLRLRSWVVDATNSVKIRADFHDDEDNNFAAGLSQCITKDGQTAITQNIPLNSRRIVSLADPIDPQDAATKDYADTKAPLAGGVPFTGDVVIKEDTPSITLDGKDGFKNSIVGQKGDKNRWEIVLGDATPETGSDAGSNFELINYADAGTALSNVLFGTRATGLLTIKGDPTAALGIATKQYTDTVGNNAINSANTRVLRAGDTMTGVLNTANAVQAIGGSGAMGTLTVLGSQPGITFHSPGTFIANFGMAGDGNFYVGGGSFGAVAYKLWTTRDFTVVPGVGTVTNAQLVMGGLVSLPFNNTVVEPANGVITGLGSAVVGGNATVLSFYFRFLQLYTTSWWTVAYA